MPLILQSTIEITPEIEKNVFFWQDVIQNQW